MTTLKKRLLLLMLLCLVKAASAQSKLNVCVVGLDHDHIYNILNAYSKGQVNIIGIAEPNKILWSKYGTRFKLPDSVFFEDTKKMLAVRKPDVVLGYNAVAKHVDIVRACAPLGLPVMVEKPLAATLGQAKEIEALSKKHNTKVWVNFETTWYASNQAAYNTFAADSIGGIRKMVFHDGHEGPIEIGCSKEFTDWLTDPILNGAGALNDFGCYGADLATWFMKGQKPIAVTAVTRQYKPQVYPKVDDDATILVEYANATVLIEGSWNWPYSIKDMEIFGEKGYIHSLDGNNVVTQLRGKKAVTRKAPPLPAPINDPLVYLAAALQGKITADDQSSLAYNMVAMQILDAAKRSAQTGKRIVL
ncbi:Gfo/Idh/MocA family protein [Mucilaginibacter myungsuensis]|uniref:Gfo/Idh/MocA family oxidoreductase n=1 Tax=Mucilaginibacter myungsuensis TaxID=649104 RepID=A0A929KZG5_9SPHI|nr:Gfo/Idh/MocA family oxidoreductase [Mucilaginibacter myungsuensis]MBE9660496.1 Gfo/Idh/MocA family oxidoreductase [Mucilaginibacter myungsuensis]MDN3600540.1 Gfo/Idh/MocA family oxidoreductase [Mucilaginibacter myungsuensis]